MTKVVLQRQEDARAMIDSMILENSAIALVKVQWIVCRREAERFTEHKLT